MAKSSKVSVGIDLGGTKMYAVVLDEKGKVIGSARNPSLGHEGSRKGLQRLIATAQEALADAKAEDKKLRGVGVGCPGVVDLDKGILKTAPNLGWSDVPVRKVLGKALDCPVTVLNDVDAGTYGEYRFGAGEGTSSLLGVFPGTGLGGGFVYRGQILHGKRYSCMELGDIRVGGSSLLRGGDEWPTLEDVTSRLAISSAITVEAYRGKAPSMVGLPINMIKSKMILNSVATDEDAVTQILDQSIHILGTGLAGVVSLLGPEMIVLGGGLVEKFPARYTSALKKRLKQLVTPELIEDLKICPAKLGDDAGALGAAAYTEVEQ